MNHDLTIGSHSGGIIKAIRYGYEVQNFIVSCWCLTPIQEGDTVTVSTLTDTGRGVVTTTVTECEWVWEEEKLPIYLVRLELLPS